MFKLVEMLQDDPHLDGLREVDGRWGVYEPHRHKIAQGSHDVILRRNHSFARGAKKVVVNSNSSLGATLKLFTGPNSKAKRERAYPYVGSCNKAGLPGVYESDTDARRDLPRFRLWLELLCPHMDTMLAMLKRTHRAEYKLYQAVVDKQRHDVQREEEEARKLRAKQHVDGLRRRKVRLPRLQELEKEYDELFNELDKGMAQMQQARGEDRDDMWVDVPEDTERRHRLQERLFQQAQSCRLFYKRLLVRTRAKIRDLQRREGVVEDAGAEPDDAEAGANGDVGDDGVRRSKRTRVTETAEEENEQETEADYDINMDTLETDALKHTGVHAIADGVMDDLGWAQGHGSSGRTLRRWAAEFAAYRFFTLDDRGVNGPEHILEDEDIKRYVREFLHAEAKKRGRDALSVDSFHRFCNDHLLSYLVAHPKVGDFVKSKFPEGEGGHRRVSRRTAHAWMKKCGAKRVWHKPSFYTDMHERDDVKAYRREYLARSAELDLRTPVWLTFEIDQYNDMREKEKSFEDVEHPFFYTKEDDVVVPVDSKEDATHVEVHCDQFENTKMRDAAKISVRWKPPAGNVSCDLHHGRCLCHLPIMRCGQDESIFKAFALPRGEWVICGVSTMRKKSSGVGEMVSAFTDEVRGLGIPLTDEELAKVNAWRLNRSDGGDKRPLKKSPGIEYLKYGKGKEGYWRYDDIEKQTMDMLDVYEALYPGYQAVMEFDWSSGHAKGQEDGLYLSKMNLRSRPMNRQGEFVAAKTIGRTRGDAGSVMQPGCFVPDGQLHNIRPGGRQSFTFKRADKVNPVEAHEEWVAVVKAEEMPKGLLQIAWERGVAIQDENRKTKSKAELVKILGEFKDFKTEVGMLERRVLDRGHLLLMSPKGHPEIAGLGIEYCWGKAKYEFRHDNTMSVAKGDTQVSDLHKRVVAALGKVDVLMARRFARKCREYARAYRICEGDKEDATDEERAAATDEERAAAHEKVQKFVKLAKTHRCILDQEYTMCTE